MKIGPKSAAASAISASNAHTIVVRGFDLVEELIGEIGFSDYVWLLAAGARPTPTQRAILDATLVAIAEHGLVPSVQASRMTLAAAPEAFQGAVAAGLLGCGSVILGASEAAGRYTTEVLSQAGGAPPPPPRGGGPERREGEGASEGRAHSSQKAATGEITGRGPPPPRLRSGPPPQAGEEGGGTRDLRIPEAVREVLARYRSAKRAIPGFGHPLHRDGDPRATKLFSLADRLGVSDSHVEVVRETERQIPQVVGKPLLMNVSAAIPAVLLDAGFPLDGLKGVPLLARAASLIGHLIEESARPIGFYMSEAGAAAVAYDGPAPVGFVAEEG